MKNTKLVKNISILLGSIFLLYIVNVIFSFFNIELTYVIPYILWCIGLVILYLLLPVNNGMKF